MSNWGLDNELMEKTTKESTACVADGFKPLDSGCYAVAIDKMYISKTASGAQMMNLAFKIEETGKLIFQRYCTRSGDEKGNKATFTIVSTHPEFLRKQYPVGSECPLPDYKFITQLFVASGSIMNDNPPENGMINVGEDIIEAKIFKTMIGKTLTVCGQVQESEYNNDISEKFVPVMYLDCEGKNGNGEEMEEKFIKKITKEPVKKLKTKKASNTAAATNEKIPF